MPVDFVKFVINIVTFFIAYCYAITVTGYFRAWVAYLCGDNTSRISGFMSVNPLVHFNFFGFLFLCMTGFGWGLYIPVNPYIIRTKSRLLCAFFSDTVLNIILALLGLLALIIWFDPSIIGIVHAMVLTRDISYIFLAHFFPERTSFVIVIAAVGAAMVALHIGLAVLEFLFNICTLGTYLVTGTSYENMEYGNFLMLLMPMLLLSLFYRYLLEIVSCMVLYAGYSLAHLLHTL